MKEPKDNWAWEELSFSQWREVVNRRLYEIYVIAIEDAGMTKDCVRIGR